MKQILDKAKNHLAQNLPFVLYKKPKDTNSIGLFQKNDTLFSVTDYTEKGFIFASFDGTKTVLIPENESEIITTVLFGWYIANHKQYIEINSVIPACLNFKIILKR